MKKVYVVYFRHWDFTEDIDEDESYDELEIIFESIDDANQYIKEKGLEDRRVVEHNLYKNLDELHRFKEREKIQHIMDSLSAEEKTLLKNTLNGITYINLPG